MMVKFFSLSMSDDVSPVWTGRLDAVPRAGENVVMPGVFRAMKVLDVTYHIEENTALVVIET